MHQKSFKSWFSEEFAFILIFNSAQSTHSYTHTPSLSFSLFSLSLSPHFSSAIFLATNFLRSFSVLIILSISIFFTFYSTHIHFGILSLAFRWHKFCEKAKTTNNKSKTVTIKSHLPATLFLVFVLDFPFRPEIEFSEGERERAMAREWSEWAFSFSCSKSCFNIDISHKINGDTKLKLTNILLDT